MLISSSAVKRGSISNQTGERYITLALPNKINKMNISTTANELLAMSENDLARLEAILQRFDRLGDTSPRITIATAHKAPDGTHEGEPVQSVQMNETKAAYKAKFGKAFRLRDGQDETDKLVIMQGCIDSGIDNGSLGKARSIESDTDEELPEGVSILD